MTNTFPFGPTKEARGNFEATVEHLTSALVSASVPRSDPYRPPVRTP